MTHREVIAFPFQDKEGSNPRLSLNSDGPVKYWVELSRTGQDTLVTPFMSFGDAQMLYSAMMISYCKTARKTFEAMESASLPWLPVSSGTGCPVNWNR